MKLNLDKNNRNKLSILNKMESMKRILRNYMNKLKSLKPIKLKHINIYYISINYFDKSSKENNDEYNKLREYIIGAIINNDIPEDYYKYSRRWNKLKNQVISYIKLIYKNEINKMCCIHKAGRNNHYDFKLIINDIEFNIEFKFNALNINDAPQFVSPMKPSQYLSMNFEEWYYDNYLIKISSYGNLEIPLREDYLSQIHNNKAECMKYFKYKYNTNTNFKKYCMKIDKEAIKKFIQITDINMEKLSKYLLEGQKNKIYMCYKENNFHYDTLNENMYKIVKLDKKENTNYVYTTESGIKLEIKLRFKNGCGLQFPAFQIKQKIPSVIELKKICFNHGIHPPKLKKDICIILDKHKIVY